VETSVISLNEKEPCHIHCCKVMLTLFFNCHGPWLIDWSPKGITVNANHYAETLEQVRSTIKTRRPSMLSCEVILLHYVRPHSTKTTHNKLQHFRWGVLPHPSYSPPCDYHVFGPMKRHKKVSALLWTQMCRNQSHHDFTDSYRTSTDMDLWNYGMSVSTTMGHMANNLVAILMLCSLLIYQTILNRILNILLGCIHV
jgi:hypothetical protein